MKNFYLMILGSQAKLENDNRGVNVQRGLTSQMRNGLATWKRPDWLPSPKIDGQKMPGSS